MSMIKALLAVSAVAMVTQHVQCDVAWMRQALTDHFSRSRHMIYPGNRSDAQEFIKNQFKGLNLELHLQTYTASLPDQNGTFTAVNIIGILKGKYFNTTDDTIIAIGAHYDTVAEGPGVNDNGAGVVVMLEAARTLAAQGQGHRNTTVLFIAFDLEEYYNGSAVLVRDWMPTLKGWQNGWKGIYVLDTVFNFDETEQAQRLPNGIDRLFPDVAARIAADKYKGNFIGAIGEKELMDTELLAKFNNSWFKQGNLKYKIAVMAVPKEVIDSGQAADLVRSDHKFFWDANKEAVFLTDTANFRGYMQECYHKQCDNSSYITDTNLQFALQLANSLADVINTYAPAYLTSSFISSSGRLTLSIAVLLATTIISINWSLVRHGID